MVRCTESHRPMALVRTARFAAGITQAQLAARAGTTQPAVAAYESGARRPNLATLSRLLRFFLEELLGS